MRPENRGAKRVTVRPSRASGVIGGVMGLIFVLLGIFVVIPIFGPFGIFWTLVAVIIAGASLYSSFGKKYIGSEIRIEDEAESSELRLEKLRELYEKRLITQEEYEQKRAEVLREL